jgi:hypothetical protein
MLNIRNQLETTHPAEEKRGIWMGRNVENYVFIWPSHLIICDSVCINSVHVQIRWYETGERGLSFWFLMLTSLMKCMEYQHQ